MEPLELDNFTIKILKQIILHELGGKIRNTYGENAFLLINHNPKIVKGDLLGFMLLQGEGLEVMHEFVDVKELVTWMGTVEE